jgi:hypothetical protein
LDRGSGVYDEVRSEENTQRRQSRLRCEGA